jgi:hypothetical protein
MMAYPAFGLLQHVADGAGKTDSSYLEAGPQRKSATPKLAGIRRRIPLWAIRNGSVPFPSCMSRRSLP